MEAQAKDWRVLSLAIFGAHQILRKSTPPSKPPQQHVVLNGDSGVQALLLIKGLLPSNATDITCDFKSLTA
ncbi:hypothetical protein VDGL01_01454 [Verticillium dahliae]